MKSMTGYGRGEWAQHGFKITVELSAVNRKQSEIAIFCPRELEPLEPQVRDELNRRIARGRLTVRVSFQAAECRVAGRMRLNTALAKEYARQLGRLAKELRLPNPVSLDLLAQAPGVLQADATALDAEACWPALSKALRQAIGGLLKMREREGAHLARDLCVRVAAMRKSVWRIQRQAPRVARRYREQLNARIKSAGLGGTAVEEQRLLQEVVIFADRADITEELTRLHSHFQQFDDCLKSKNPVGRTLDFLAQEMNREVNTIGSKANDSLISRHVVKLKAELERFREQVQNVE
jgi:uncharacterized protein (TIGR00255 family)